MTDALIQGGTLYANAATRIVRGLVLPWGETSRPSNIGPISFKRGSVKIPRDPSIVTGNIRHSREDPVARAVKLEDTEAGIVGEFAIANTDEGDTLLAEIAEGKLSRLSPEVKNILRRGTEGVSGFLFGTAFVDEGAFASATLYAELAAESHTSEEYTDSEGRTWRLVRDSVTETETAEDGTEKTTTVTTVTEEIKPEKPAEDEEAPVVDATVPETLHASTTTTGPATTDLTGLFAAIRAGASQGDFNALNEIDQEARKTGLFALADVKTTGTLGTNTSAGVPQYVGQLWSGRRFQRRVIPLIGSAPLTSFEVKGWRWGTKPKVGRWAGNKSDIPTNSPTTTSYSVGVQRFAGGHDIAREFTDFNVTEVLEAYTQAMVDSYAEESDLYVLEQLLLAAGDGTAAEDYPTVGQLTISPAVGKIIQGAVSIVTANAVPAWALVAPDVFKQLAYTPKAAVSEFLSQSLNLEDPSATVGFRVVPHASMPAGQVLVGAQEAATALELPGSPIRVNALDIARGGLDEAIFGYCATKVELPSALALITNAA